MEIELGCILHQVGFFARPSRAVKTIQCGEMPQVTARKMNKCESGSLIAAKMAERPVRDDGR